MKLFISIFLFISGTFSFLTAASALPSRYQLGMNDVPVHDQEQRARDGGFGNAMSIKLYEKHSRHLVTHKD